jgi:predicted nucleic acid-binding Zn ribbon protein
MPSEGKVYLCDKCGAEVNVLKKPAEDPKCPTLLCCGKDMKEKEETP